MLPMRCMYVCPTPYAILTAPPEADPYWDAGNSEVADHDFGELNELVFT